MKWRKMDDEPIIFRKMVTQIVTWTGDWDKIDKLDDPIQEKQMETKRRMMLKRMVIYPGKDYIMKDSETAAFVKGGSCYVNDNLQKEPIVNRENIVMTCERWVKILRLNFTKIKEILFVDNRRSASKFNVVIRKRSDWIENRQS
jgi:hypothetical protein